MSVVNRGPFDSAKDDLASGYSPIRAALNVRSKPKDVASGRLIESNMSF